MGDYGRILLCAATLMLSLLGCASGVRRDAETTDSSFVETAASEPARNSPPTAAATATQSQPASSSAREQSPLRMLDNFHAIEEGRAYRSAQLYAESLDWVIKHYGIRTVINLRGPNPQMEWYPREKMVCEQNSISLIDIPLSAFSLPPPDRLLDLYDALQGAPEPILIHCRAGADRTGMAAALWRITKRGEAPQSAAAELSLKYGHFRVRHPKMLEMVEMFQPVRDWIRDEYPRIFQGKNTADARVEE